MIQNIEKINDESDGLMPKETFERRFYFIDQDMLRKNIAIAFEYIFFLLETAKREDHKPLIRSSLCKDAAVYTGTVIEACLLHALKKYLVTNSANKAKVLGRVWTVTDKGKDQGTIYEFSKKRRIRYVLEHFIVENIGETPRFNVICRSCLRAKIISKKEYKFAEDIMKARNKIHVSGLQEIDNAYTREALDDIFDKATRIIRKIEKKLL